MPTTVDHLVSVEQLEQRSPALSKRLLRHWLHLNFDGFRDACAVKIGRRLLLDVAAVEAWLETHRSNVVGE